MIDIGVGKAGWLFIYILYIAQLMQLFQENPLYYGAYEQLE